MLPQSIRDMITEAEIEPNGRIVLHCLPHIAPSSPFPAEVDMVVVDDSKQLGTVLEQRGITGGDDIVITSTTPISAYEAHLSAEQITGWLHEAGDMARAEGSSQILVGYDPLHPEASIEPTEIGVTGECVFDWSRTPGMPPIFEWKDVALMRANRGSPTAEIYLVDGRSVFLHAGIDWFNRLS